MKVLYLRTMFPLGIKAGGSVGHTAGVIHGFVKQVELDIYSNDALVEVHEDIHIIRPWICKWMPQSLMELFNNLQFLFFLKGKMGRYDIIYQRYSGFSFVGAYLSNKAKIPFILEFNSSEVWKMKNWSIKKNTLLKRMLSKFYKKFFAFPTVRFFERYNIKSAYRIIVVSNVLKEQLISSGVAEEKVFVNPNAVDPRKFHPNCGGKEIRDRLGIKEAFVFGFLGTFGQWHGVEEMAKAIVYFFRKHKEFCGKVVFLLIGDGVLLPNVKKILREGGIEDEVIFTGMIPQEKAPSYLDACDAFLSPHIANVDGSHFFGSPTKLFEYMAMGKGIIASNLDQIGEILEHGKTAYLVEPGNSISLADAMVQFLENPALCYEFGMCARKKALEDFTWDRHVEKILKAIE